MGETGVEDIRKTVLICSLILFVASYTSIFYFRDINTAKHVYSMKDTDVGQRVYVTGVVKWVRSKNGLFFGSVNTGVGEFRFVSHHPVKTGYINATGVVREYKGEREVDFG